jgi:hypothetical protein
MNKSHSCLLPQAFVAALIVLCLVLPCAAQPRIIAVGDIHGACTELVGLLQQTKIIDDHRQWIGGSTILVQTGDVPDRGTQTRAAFDLLMELERQAPDQGGKVVALLGNHEVMTILGDLRYVSSGDYQSFATPQSDERREREYRDWRKFAAAHDHGPHPNLPKDEEAARPQWMAEHPLGFFERRDAFGPEGVYGRWLRAHEAMVKIGDGLFMHGGLNPDLPSLDIAELNHRIHSEIANFDLLWKSLSEKEIIWKYMTMSEAIRWVQEEWAAIQLRGQVEDKEAAQNMLKLLELPRWFINSPDSPLWYRGLALQPEENIRASLESALDKLKVRYLVAGHSTQPKSEILPRFDNRVFLIDTGMLKEAYRGRASALEILDGKFTACYLGEKPRELGTPIVKSEAGEDLNKGKGRQEK